MRIKNKILVLAEEITINPKLNEVPISSNSKISPKKQEEEKINSEKREISTKDELSHSKMSDDLKDGKEPKEQLISTGKSSQNFTMKREKKDENERISTLQNLEVEYEKKIIEKTIGKTSKFQDPAKKNKFYKTRGGRGQSLEKEKIEYDREKIKKELLDKEPAYSEQPEKENSKESSFQKNQSINKRKRGIKEEKKRETRKESSEKENFSKSDFEKGKNNNKSSEKKFSEKSIKNEESHSNESNKRKKRSQEKIVALSEQDKTYTVPKKERSNISTLSSKEKSIKAKESSIKASSEKEESNQRITRSRDRNLLPYSQTKDAKDQKNHLNTISGDEKANCKREISQNRIKEEKNSMTVKEIVIAEKIEEITIKTCDKNTKKVAFLDANKSENQESGRRRRLEFLEDSADKKDKLEVDSDETFFERLHFLDDLPEGKNRKRQKKIVDNAEQDSQLKIKNENQEDPENPINQVFYAQQQVLEKSDANVVKKEILEVKEQFHEKNEEKEDPNPPNKKSTILKTQAIAAKTKKKVDIKLPATPDHLERPRIKRKNEISPPKMNEADLNAPMRTRSQRGIKPKSPLEKENIYHYDDPTKKISYKENNFNEKEEEYNDEEEEKESSEEEFVVRVRKPKNSSQNSSNIRKQQNNNKKQKGLKKIKEEKMEIENEHTKEDKDDENGEGKEMDEEESEGENSMRSSNEEEYDPQASRKRRMNFGRRKDGKRIKKESDSDREMKELTVLNQNLIDYTLHYLF